MTPKNRGWLSGVGIYYKGAIGYGGFVGAMVSTYGKFLNVFYLNSREIEQKCC